LNVKYDLIFSEIEKNEKQWDELEINVNSIANMTKNQYASNYEKNVIEFSNAAKVYLSRSDGAKGA
jgi:hypothetical protein